MKLVGDYVKQGEVIAKIYFDKKVIDVNELLTAYTIEDDLKEKEPLMLGVIK